MHNKDFKHLEFEEFKNKAGATFAHSDIAFADKRCLTPGKFVAEANKIIVGAVWVRIMDDYGHVDDETPFFAISLLKEYRGNGIGTEMMKYMLDELRDKGYKKTSLASKNRIML